MVFLRWPWTEITTTNRETQQHFGNRITKRENTTARHKPQPWSRNTDMNAKPKEAAAVYRQEQLLIGWTRWWLLLLSCFPTCYFVLWIALGGHCVFLRFADFYFQKCMRGREAVIVLEILFMRRQVPICVVTNIYHPGYGFRRQK